MKDSELSESNITSKSLADGERSLPESPSSAASGDIYVAQQRVEHFQELVTGAGRSTLSPEESEQARKQWLDALSDLMALYEEREAYPEALTCARALCQHDPTRQADLRRATYAYVLSGSRAPHLSTLRRRIQSAQSGNGSLVLIQGEAGIGKSSLAGVGLDWARRQGAITAVGRCYEHGVALPLAPWQDVLQSLAKATATEHDQLPSLLGNQPVDTSADSLIDRVGSYLFELVSNRPVALLLEDLHWADQSTISLLEYVSRRIEQLPLLLLSTYRSEEVDRHHPLHPYLLTLQRDRPTAVIRLAEFDLDDTSRFISSHLGPCTPDLVQYLHQRSDGHPLFLVELLDNLEEQKLLTYDDDGRWAPPDRSVPIPTLLRQVILQRVDRLGQPGESLLDAAAVMGDVWMLSVVEALLGWPEEQLLDVLDEVLSLQIVEPDDERGERYRFRHTLIREALYRRQLPRRRRHLHARIAEQIESDFRRQAASESRAPDEIVGELTFHYFRAERWQEAYSFGLEATERASQRNAPHEVLRYGRQALMAFEQEPEAATADGIFYLREQLGQALLLLGQRDEARDSFTNMLDVAHGTDDRARVANALLRLAEAQERAYEHDLSEQTRKAASDLVSDEADSILLARFHWDVAHHHMVTGGLEAARQHLSKAERHAREGNQGEILLNTAVHQAYLAIFQASYAEAERLIQALMARARAIAHMPRLAQACWQLGFVQTERAQYERARESLLEGIELGESIGEHHYTLVRIRNSLGYLHRELGDLDSAMHWNQAALDTNRQARSSHHAVECACYSLIDLAANCLAAGQLDASEAYFREFETAADGTVYARYRYYNRAQLFLAELALAQNKYELASERADQAMEIATREIMRKNMVRGMYLRGRALGGLNRYQDAAHQLLQAVELADEIGHTGLRWKARLALADVYALSGHDDAKLLREAQVVVNGIVGQLHEQSLRDAFLKSTLVTALQARIDGQPSSANEKSPPAESRPAGLTRREVEVLRLVAAGLTDRQIGEQLHITVRTVNTHVTNILNKTASHNRTAAATFAVQHGLIDRAS